MANEPENIISFPFQVAADDAPLDDLTDAELVWRARKEAAWLLNQRAIGRITEISEESRQWIQTINDFCIKYGYPPIDFDL